MSGKGGWDGWWVGWVVGWGRRWGRVGGGTGWEMETPGAAMTPTQWLMPH